MKHFKYLAIIPITLFCFSANPAYLMGCSSTSQNGTKYSFNESDLKTLIVGQWSGPVTFKDGAKGTLTLELKQGSKKLAALNLNFIKSAHACGNRSFVKSAQACIDTTSMPIEGTMTLTKTNPDTAQVKIVDNKPVSGAIRVNGKRLSNATLDIQSGDHNVRMFSEDGKVFQPSTLAIAKNEETTVKLTKASK